MSQVLDFAQAGQALGPGAVTQVAAASAADLAAAPPGDLVFAAGDVMTVTLREPAKVIVAYGKTTRAVLHDMLAQLGRTAGAVRAAPLAAAANPRDESAWFKCWIKSTRAADEGRNLALVDGVGPIQANIVLGRPIQRVEMIGNKPVAWGAGAAQAAEPAVTADPLPENSGDDE